MMAEDVLEQVDPPVEGQGAQPDVDWDLQHTVVSNQTGKTTFQEKSRIFRVGQWASFSKYRGFKVGEAIMPPPPSFKG